MRIGLLPYVATAAHGEQQMLGKGVDHRNADAVQSTGDLVGVVIELTAGMQHGHDDLGGGNTFLLVDVHRDATTVVAHADGFIRVDGDGDIAAMPCQRFVNRVVDHLEHHVVQTAAIIGIADVHARSLAYGIQAFQDLNVIGVVRLVFAHASLPVVVGLGDTAMFHVEHGNGRIRAPAFPQQFMVYTGDEHLAVQVFQQAAQGATVLFIQF
ncbi:hypothetical protein FQZ97_937830 [compost metagenome]